jgi:hypothetical protein
VNKFNQHAVASGLAIALGIAASLWFSSPEALLAVALSGASGPLALLLKRRALAHSGIAAVMVVMVAMMVVRAGLLAAGLWATVRTDANPVAFIAGFFLVYAAQQVAELSWVVSAAKALNGAQAT